MTAKTKAFRHNEFPVLAVVADRPTIQFTNLRSNKVEFRRLGASGFTVPVLSFGTGTFGGKGEFFQAWGATDVNEARRLVDICLEAGVNMFDSADIYSGGAAESVLGAAIKDRPRNGVIISTKTTFRASVEHNDVGSSRYHLIQAGE